MGQVIYTGIGSRRAPPEMLGRAEALARRLAASGLHLRSGGALGMDRAFERGAPADQRTIYRPAHVVGDAGEAAFALFDAEVAPLAGCGSIRRMRPPIAALLARNMFQVLGLNLATPTRAVVCWTPLLDYTHRDAGGTRYACLLAQARAIPIFNLAHWTVDEAAEQVRALARS